MLFDDDNESARGLARRDLFTTFALAVAGGDLLFDAAGAHAQGISTKPTDQAVELFARLVGDLSGKVTLTYTAGTIWGFRPQAGPGGCRRKTTSW